MHCLHSSYGRRAYLLLRRRIEEWRLIRYIVTLDGFKAKSKSGFWSRDLLLPTRLHWHRTQDAQDHDVPARPFLLQKEGDRPVKTIRSRHP